MPLVLTNQTTGQQTTITDSTSLELAILSVKDHCTSYSNTADDAKLTLAKSYADSLSAKLASDLAVVIPDVDAVIPESLNLSLGIHSFNFVKDMTNTVKDMYIAKIYQNVLVINNTDGLVVYYKDQKAFTDNIPLDSFTFTAPLTQSLDIPQAANNYLSGVKITYVDVSTYKVDMTLMLTLRDESYINAIGVAAKVYALKLVTDLGETFNQLVLDTALNTKRDANLYTDTKIQAKDTELKAYIDNHKWLVASITDIATFAQTERDITNVSLQALQEQINQILSQVFSEEMFEYYLLRMEDDLYPKKLNQTCYIEQGMQKFKSFDKDTTIEFINHYPFTPDEVSTFKIVVHDANHNGYALLYEGHGTGNTDKNVISLYSFEAHALKTRILKVLLGTNGEIQLDTQLKIKVDSIYDAVATQSWVRSLLVNGSVDQAALEAVKLTLTNLINTNYQQTITNIGASLTEAKAYTDQKFTAISTLNVTQSYVDNKALEILNSAKSYADTQDQTVLQNSKSYTKTYADQIKIDCNIYANGKSLPMYVPFLFAFNPLGTYSTESGTNGSWTLTPGTYLICNGTSFNVTKFADYSRFLGITGQTNNKTPNFASPHPNYKYIVRVA